MFSSDHQDWLRYPQDRWKQFPSFSWISKFPVRFLLSWLVIFECLPPVTNTQTTRSTPERFLHMVSEPLKISIQNSAQTLTKRRNIEVVLLHSNIFCESHVWSNTVRNSPSSGKWEQAIHSVPAAKLSLAI